jgi:hypothetical protein
LARPREHGKHVDGFAVNFYDEDREILEKMEDLRRKDGFGKGDFVKVALREYVVRHHPGNPTIPLDHFVPGGPDLSQAAREKLGRRQRLPDDMVWRIHEKCYGEGCEECHWSGKVAHRLLPQSGAIWHVNDEE